MPGCQDRRRRRVGRLREVGDDELDLLLAAARPHSQANARAVVRAVPVAHGRAKYAWYWETMARLAYRGNWRCSAVIVTVGPALPARPGRSVVRG